MDLKEFLQSFDGKPVEWGVDDCSAFVAQWVEIRCGCSFRLPEYRTKREAQKVIVDAGGLLNIWNEFLSAADIHETGYPEKGDIGLIHTEKHGPVGMIYYGAFWAWRRDDGLYPFTLAPRNLIKAWAI